MKEHILLALMSVDIGGAETHVLELAIGLKKRGYYPVIVSAGGTYEKEFAENGIPHYYAPLTSKNPINMIRSYYIMKRIILKEKIDVVHGHARIPSFILGLLCKRMKFPFLTSAHGTYNLAEIFRFLTNWGQRTISVSNDISKYLTENYHIPKNHIIMSVNGINTDKFGRDIDSSDVMEEFHLQADKVRIVHVSRLDDDSKDVAFELLDAAQRLKKEIPNLEVIVVGNGKYFNDLQKKAHQFNGKDPYIILTGGRMDVYKFLGLADVFVGIARSALEALSCEKNVILAGISGYLGLFGEDKLEMSEKTNFTCRGYGETTSDILYRDLKYYFTQMTEEEKEHLRQFGRQVVLKNYSLDKMINTNIEAYETVLAHYKHYNDFVVLGYYGFANSGDDSLLHAIIQDIHQLDSTAKICVLSKNPKSTRQVYGVDAVNRLNPFSMLPAIRNSRVLLAGSGNLIQDGTSSKSLYYYLYVISYAQRHGLKTMLYANGIGPVNKEKNIIRSRYILNKMDYITLREPDSVKELTRMHVQNEHIKLTADPVFRLQASQDENIANDLLMQLKNSSQKYFGVSVRKWSGCKKDFYNELAKTCDYITSEYHMTAVFLPMQRTYDVEYSERVRAAMTSPSLMLSDTISGSDMMGIIRHMDFMIAMRLHAFVYAANVGVPIFGIDYNPKVSGFMKYIGFKNYITIPEFSLENNIPHIQTCLQEGSSLSEENIVQLHEKSFSNAQIAVSLLKEQEKEHANG